jgi:hypothetical protein
MGARSFVARCSSTPQFERISQAKPPPARDERDDLQMSEVLISRGGSGGARTQ